MNLNTCQTVTRETLELFKDKLKLSAEFPAFLKPSIRSALIEAIGAWRAEAILGPEITLTIRRPPRYTQNSGWMA